MYRFRKNILTVTTTVLLVGLVSGCGGSSSSSSRTVSAFPTTELFLDFNLPFSVLERSMPEVSGISFNHEDDYYLISSADGQLLFMSPSGEVLDEASAPQSFTGIEFVEAGAFLLSDNNRILSYRVDTQEVEELYSFAGRYENIQSIAYREETEEAVFVNNGDVPVLVYLDQAGVVTEFVLEERFRQYAIDGLQLLGDYIYMGSTGYQRDNASDRKSTVIQTALNGDFIQAWELDEKVLSAVAVIDEDKPRFITTNLDEGGSFNLYEPEPLPSMASEPPLMPLGAVELEFNQPSGVDLLLDSNTFYYMTDFGEVRSGTIEGDSTLLFEIDAQQGSYEALAASVSNNDIELHIVNSDGSSAGTQIETYSIGGELLRSFQLALVDGEHFFESVDFDSATARYFMVNGNEDSRKYLYTIENGNAEILELPSDYDAYYITGLDYAPNSQYLYFVTEEFEDENGKNAGLLVIYDTANAVEAGRYSIVDATEPMIGVENPSGVTVNGDGSEVYITSDIDGSVLHYYSIDTE